MRHDGKSLSKADDEEIRAAFQKIKAKDSVKEHIQYEVLRSYQKDGYVSKAKLKFAKHRFDRYVPAVAACVILVCCISFYGVSTGWFTGREFTPTNQLLEENGVSYPEESSEATFGAAASESETTDSAETTTEAADEASAGTKTADKALDVASIDAELVDITVFAAKDIGFTQYNIVGIPYDAFTLWTEMQDIGAAPTAFDLLSYSFDDSGDDSVIVLDFDSRLQDFLDSSATTDVMTGIVKSISAMYPEYDAVQVNSDGNPALFEGKELDTASMLVATVDITSSEDIVYSE